MFIDKVIYILIRLVVCQGRHVWKLDVILVSGMRHGITSCIVGILWWRSLFMGVRGGVGGFVILGVVLLVLGIVGSWAQHFCLLGSVTME